MQTVPPTNALRRPTIGKEFGAVLTFSLATHLAVLIGYGIYDANKMDVIELPDEPIKAVFVKLGKPRDEKLLPRLKTAPPPANTAPAPQAKPDPKPEKPQPKDDAVAVPLKEAKEKDKKKPEPTKQPEPDVEDRKLSALDKIRQRVAAEDKMAHALGKVADRVGKLEEEEDEGQEDGRPDGDSPTPGQVNLYLASLHGAVKAHYLVPSVIQPMECVRLVAVVMVRMGLDGSVQEAKVHKSSGNEFFDGAVVQAVKAASPLPIPPPNMRDMALKGFGFQFRCNR